MLSSKMASFIAVNHFNSGISISYTFGSNPLLNTIGSQSCRSTKATSLKNGEKLLVWCYKGDYCWLLFSFQFLKFREMVAKD